MTSKLRLVVFDIAGTTMEDHGDVNHALAEALATAGKVVTPTAIDAVMGLAKPEAIRRLLPVDDATPDRVDSIHADFLDRMKRHYEGELAVRPIAGIEAVFRELHGAGIAIALDTGFSRGTANLLLERLGWLRDGLVDAVITSDEVEHARPASDMIRALMERFGMADSGQVAKVGDAPADIEEGRNARCGVVIGVTWGTHTRGQLRVHQADHVIDRPEELIPLLIGT